MGGDNAARTLNMSEYEQILLGFADRLRKQESFKYDRRQIIQACEAGAYAIHALNQEQEYFEITGDLDIDQRCYKETSK